MLLSERRRQYRRVLESNVCLHPASVFDAMSPRMAASLGFEIGMFAGSIASGTVLGAPDLVVLTLTEFADQIRRITRGSDLPLMVDANHGYGNALNVCARRGARDFGRVGAEHRVPHRAAGRVRRERRAE